MSEDELQKRVRIENSIKHCYSTWGTTYYDDYYGPGAPYPPVHIDLLRKVLAEGKVRKVLDAGCGPASFLRHLGKEDMELFGFDLTHEMVDEAKRQMERHGRDPQSIWQGSVLDPADYRSSPAEHGLYDAAVCVGVLPHIPESGDESVFANLASAVRSGGLVAVEARNQLFSLFTLNRPSCELFKAELIQADSLRERLPIKGRAALDTALQELEAQFRMDLPPVRRGKSGEPGYDEVLSRTHNPLVLAKVFEANGFTNVRTLFYHYHALPPMLSRHLGDHFVRESLALEDPESWRGYFMASAFILVGRRA